MSCTLNFYVFLCIFPIKVFPVKDGLDENSVKEPHMGGDIVNTFKKPFININQVRNGWPEENLILKIMGTSQDDIEEGGTPYQSSVRSLGFTTHLNTSTKFKS